MKEEVLLKKGKKEVEMSEEMDEEVLLKKGENDVVLFVKDEQEEAIKLVKLDLKKHIMLNSPKIRVRA